MVAIVTFLWDTGQLHRRKGLKFTKDHVNALYRMCKRNIDVEFDFFCVTDQDNSDLDYKIKHVPIWDDLAECGQCFRRLKLFHESSRELFGDRIIQIDLDTVITGNITDIVKRQEPLIFFRSKNKTVSLNGSFWSIVPGKYQYIFDEFDPDESRRIIQQKRMVGSDQAWITHMASNDLVTLDEKDGFYSYNVDIRSKLKNELPDNARMVFFHGKFDPSQKIVQANCPWVKEHWG